MANESRGNAVKTHEEILARIRGLTASIRDGAAAAEEARTLPRETIDALVSAGITRILVPPRFGGYGLGLNTWFEVVREIAQADGRRPRRCRIVAASRGGYGANALSALVGFARADDA
jgi:alkylation response protein AidB-like acyl-CoA dehydrogenase